ncbi:MAG: sulfotransferase family 2 domain-containing protein [Rhodobacteraceae bacterium]|nr:sulfotransferase family 2 domain-containing protein [Paracoccaceae bacterium]
MPFFRAGPGIYFFAHVPKCAGSSVEDYLRDRFGRPGFVDNRFVQRPEAERWTRTSPQHADWATVERLFGPDFFDGAFAVVRHPLSRAVSAYHFQVEVEKTAPAGIGFGDWLQEMRARQAREPFAIDNHFRPQVDFLPPGCALFHLEHGVDALVPYLDRLTGTTGGPRAIGHANRRGGGSGGGKDRGKAAPDPAAVALVAEIYAEDFRRLGYRPDSPDPAAAPPALDPRSVAEAAADRARSARPDRRLVARVRRKVRRWAGA